MTKLVVLFNWHFYLAAAAVCLVCGFGVYLTNIFLLQIALKIALGAATYFMWVSVIGAYFVYDRSDLYKLEWWPARVLPEGAKDAVLVHAGFDPASAKLQEKYPDLDWSVLCFFHPETTTEASIRTARKLYPPTEEERTMKPGEWPIEDQSQDIIFMISSAHEIRKETERVAFLSEARRVLRGSGRIVIIEQLRDLRNMAVFGVAAWHFLSLPTWRQTFQSANLEVVEEFEISYWMKAFVLSATP